MRPTAPGVTNLSATSSSRCANGAEWFRGRKNTAKAAIAPTNKYLNM
jgi:hypothetical protein